MKNVGFRGLDVVELKEVDGGANMEKVADGFLTVLGTIGAACMLTGGAAVTAAVSTIAAPVIVLGVAGAAIGGNMMGEGLME